jgi:cytochrome c553
MKKSNIQMFASTTAIAAIFVLSVPAQAQNASETLYKSKCAACHGSDGSGSEMGKKLGAHDFQTAEVQKMSDVELCRTWNSRMSSRTARTRCPRTGSL